MMPLPLARFSLVSHPGEYRDWPLRTKLLDAGRATETDVPGYVLRYQFEVEAGFLLVTDWDCPYEESTEFILLDPQLRLLQRLSKNAPYSSWYVDTMDVVDIGKFRVAFGPEDPWILSVKTHPTLLLGQWMALCSASDPG